MGSYSQHRNLFFFNEASISFVQKDAEINSKTLSLLHTHTIFLSQTVMQHINKDSVT